MPAERINVSFEPRPLEVLYSKYGPEKVAPRSAFLKPDSNPSPFLKPAPSPSPSRKPTSSSHAQARGVVRRSRGDAPTRFPKRQELGDLRKLGRELTKIERVHMFLDMSSNVAQGKKKSRSEPHSAGVDLRCLQTKCNHCSEDHRREDGQRRLQTMKSMLRLVAARGLPDCPSTTATTTTTTTTTVRCCSKRVVPLPLLQLDPQRNASSSEDFVALRDARRTLRHMFFPPHSVSRRATAVWNYRFDSGGRAPHSRQYRGGGADSSDASFQVLPPVGVPACSPADDRSCPTVSATTFDADRVDSEQFEYVFERFSLSSTDSTTGTSLSPESDTGTYSARAQRPSTTDTVATPQRQIETRASLAPPLSPLSPRSPRQRARGGESWPPQFTVVPSWPSVDDPYRFQYFGCGVHRDVMRRLHRSRGRRRASRQSQPQPQPQPQPQKLEVVVPSHTDCDVCNTADECRHSLRQRPNTGHQSHAASLTAKSAKSRDSLPMSVCTVLSRPPHQRLPNGRVPNDKEPAQVAAHVEGSSSDSGQCEGFQHKGELLNTAHSHVTRRKRMPSGRGVSDVGTRREAVPLSKGQADVAHWKERAV